MDLLRWLDSFSALITRHSHDSKTLKKILFMGHEISSDVTNDSRPPEILESISYHLFNEQRFKISDDSSASTESDFLLSEVIKNKGGNARIVGLIYKALAESLGVSLDLLDLPTTSILRYASSENLYYVDLENEGSLLSSIDLLHRLNGMNQLSEELNASYLEPLHSLNLVFFILEKLRKLYSQATSYEKHLLVLDLLVHEQIAKVHALGERALLLAKMGFRKEALNDLKRYFSFHDMEYSPSEVVKTFKKLRANERTRRSRDLIIIK